MPAWVFPASGPQFLESASTASGWATVRLISLPPLTSLSLDRHAPGCVLGIPLDKSGHLLAKRLDEGVPAPVLTATHVRVWRLAGAEEGRRPTLAVTIFDRGRNARPCLKVSHPMIDRWVGRARLPTASPRIFVPLLQGRVLNFEDQYRCEFW